MIDKIIEITSSAFQLKERETGEFKSAKVGPMTFTTRCFEVSGVGNMSVMTGKALFGLMKMDTVVINPFDCDMPLLSYDRIKAMGNDTLILEIYETRLDKSDTFEGLKSLSDTVKDIPDFNPGQRWYDSIRLDASVGKKGKKKDSSVFDKLVSDFIGSYTELLKNAPTCDRQAKIKAASVYTEGLLSNGGASTDQFVKAKGKEYTEKFFREYLFGTGNP